MTNDSTALLTQLFNQQFGDQSGGQPGVAEMMKKILLEKQEKQQQERKKEVLKIKRLRREIVTLREVVEGFAAMFGACPQCLGQYDHCPECEGKGMPGFFELDERLLISWLKPALQGSEYAIVHTNKVDNSSFKKGE